MIKFGAQFLNIFHGIEEKVALDQLPAKNAFAWDSFSSRPTINLTHGSKILLADSQYSHQNSTLNNTKELFRMKQEILQ